MRPTMQIRALCTSENGHPGLPVDIKIRFVKNSLKILGAKIYRCTLVSKPNVQHSLLLQAGAWKKFNSLHPRQTLITN